MPGGGGPTGLARRRAAVALALASGGLVRDGPDVTGIRETPFGWVMAGLAGVAVLVMLAAAVPYVLSR